MATPIVMPKFGQMTEESAIVEWRKKEGEKVAKGDILFTAQTDKAVMEVESFEEGTLLKIVVQPGVSVPVQSTVGFLGEPGEAVPEASAPAPAAARSEAAQSSVAAPAAARAAAPGLFRISPRAAALAAKHGLEATQIAGTGPGGRVIEKDVKAFLDSKSSAAPAQTEKPLSRMRQIIAERLTRSARTIPHFHVTVAADMTDLLSHRARLKERGPAPSVTAFIAHAVVRALKEFPDVNGSTDGRIIRLNERVNLGLAVSMKDGLVVPVIRDADGLDLARLSARAEELAEKARAGKLPPDDMIGGTFTISNMGMLDVENFTAIIVPGESAILAVSSILKKPAARGGQVVLRSMMKMTLSADHRLIDGATAARFLNAVKQSLEAPPQTD